MTRHGRRFAGASRALRTVNSLAAFVAPNKNFSGTVEQTMRLSSIQRQRGHLMKVTTIALATAFTLTSTFALAQADGTAGYGSVVAPSGGSYPATVGSTNVVPTWRNTGPAAPLPSVPAVGNTFGSTFAPIGGPGAGPAMRASGVRR